GIPGDLRESVEDAEEVLIKVWVGPVQGAPGPARPVLSTDSPGRGRPNGERGKGSPVESAQKKPALLWPVRVASSLEHRVGIAPDDFQEIGRGLLAPPLDKLSRGSFLCAYNFYQRMGPVNLILDKIALVESEPAPPVALSRQDVDVPIPVPVNGVDPRDHLRRPGPEDHLTFGRCELRLGSGLRGTHVP